MGLLQLPVVLEGLAHVAQDSCRDPAFAAASTVSSRGFVSSVAVGGLGYCSGQMLGDIPGTRRLHLHPVGMDRALVALEGAS
jgi:hypothetical protein